MENNNLLLQHILACNEKCEKENVKNILILYDERVCFIGDSCMRFDMLEIFKSFFKNARVQLNWQNVTYNDIYFAILKNNPYIDEMSNHDWQDINFRLFDVIICINYKESYLLEILTNRYESSINYNHCKTAIFSMSSLALNLTNKSVTTVFPNHNELTEFVNQYPHTPQVYISNEEKEWANQTLKMYGLEEDEQLVILLDSSSSRAKLLKMDVYFKVLEHILSMNKTKILIFDEKGLGKKLLYKEWLTKEQAGKIIFTTNLNLRQALCIMSSNYTKLILGPCTGLLHCASGIYNTFVRNSMKTDDVPVMITYTGKYEREDDNANLWWGTSPLVNCLILRKTATGKEVKMLSELSDQEKQESKNILPCSEYTSAIIIDYLKKVHQNTADKEGIALS